MNKVQKNHLIVLKTFIFSLMLMSLTACNDTSDTEKKVETGSPVAEIKQMVFDELVGTWKSENGKNFEQWTKRDDGTYQSRVYSVKGTDTSWTEQAHIYRENDNWIFENTVKGQNDGKAVKFTSIMINEKSVRFTNPLHDFPTHVNYTLPDANTLNAFIIGPGNKEGKDTIHFNYTRLR